MMCVMETACSKVPLHPSPQRTHLQDSELPAFVRPAGQSREKVHSDWPHVPCTDPWGLGKCAWNKPPGPWWSWATSPSPRHPGFTSSGSHSGLRLFLGWEGGWFGDTSVPLQLFLVLMTPFSLLWESLGQKTTSVGLDLGRMVQGWGH